MRFREGHDGGRHREGKVVGRYLAPYLATRAASSESRYVDR